MNSPKNKTHTCAQRKPRTVQLKRARKTDEPNAQLGSIMRRLSFQWMMEERLLLRLLQEDNFAFIGAIVESSDWVVINEDGKISGR